MIITRHRQLSITRKPPIEIKTYGNFHRDISKLIKKIHILFFCKIIPYLQTRDPSESKFV